MECSKQGVLIYKNRNGEPKLTVSVFINHFTNTLFPFMM